MSISTHFHVLHRSCHPARTLIRTNVRSKLTSKPTTPPTHNITTATAFKMPTAPGEQFEVRQTSTSEDYTPDPSKSLPLSPARQALVDDIIALYSCEPTIKRVERYTADCVYDDQFVYANDRYKMAGQWFALPKLFKASKNEGYQIIRSDNEVIQFKNEQSWTFKIIPKTATINALVTLSLDPDTADSEFMQIKQHKDQARKSAYPLDYRVRY
jgi:hypothetical protein